MKKNLFMVAAVALMALTACNKEEVAGGNQDVQPVAPTTVVEFTASFSETKTALNAEGKKTLWVETDKIDINGQEFKIKELVDGGLAAKFENVNELPANFAAPFTAKYPYGVEEVPATQTAYAGTFDPDAVLEIATSDDHNLSFTNVTSLLKFQVPAACKTVTISSDNVLAGSNAKTVTVNGSFEAGKTYYAAVLPGTKANFVVRIDGYLSKNATSVTIDESTIANMKTLPAPVASNVKIKGNFTGGNNWSEEVYFFNDLNGLVLRKNVSGLNKEFKFINGQTWLGGPYAVSNKWCMTWDGANFKLPLEKCDIYFDTNTSFFSIVDVDSSVSEYQYIYLKPNSDWKSSGARFAVAFLSSDKATTYWYSMVYNASNDVYECIVPGGYKYMIFCRMNGSKPANNWDNKWNQTADLEIPSSNGNNYYTITGWDKSGTWSKKSINR